MAIPFLKNQNSAMQVCKWLRAAYGADATPRVPCGPGRVLQMMLPVDAIRNCGGEFQVDCKGVPLTNFAVPGDRVCGTIGPFMTRFELLNLLVAQARANGFEFRKWYIGKLGLPWETTQKAIETLCAERRYYALLFSHEFASNFWKAGERITFQVPMQTFTRRRKDGTIATVSRKGYTRRSARDDAWRYHLRELALADEPLRYMRRYLRVEEELDLEDEALGEGGAAQGGETRKPIERPAGGGLAIVRSRLT
jgi:hypothetical protein